MRLCQGAQCREPASRVLCPGSCPGRQGGSSRSGSSSFLKPTRRTTVPIYVKDSNHISATFIVSPSSPLLATYLKGRYFSSCQLSTLCLPHSSPRLAKHQPPPPHLRAKIGTAHGYLNTAVTNTDEFNINLSYLGDCSPA